jgi:hypothetical protein
VKKNWNLEICKDHINGQEYVYTPQLPTEPRPKFENNIEKIILVPYGCTQLRLTIFPECVRQRMM